MDEIKAHEQASDAAQWLASLKKSLVDARRQAGIDMKNDHTETTGRKRSEPDSDKKSSKKSKKSNKDKKTKRKAKSCSASGSGSQVGVAQI